MKLPFSLPTFGKKETDDNYYLILLLRDEKASAVILKEETQTVRVIGISETEFPRLLEEVTDDSLLDILDKTISRAEESLPTNMQTEMTVFGVKDSWVEDKKIKDIYLDRLKTAGKALSLKPIGFLVISEAIAHLIQDEEGAPVSAIVAEIGNYSIMLSLFRGGKLLETKSAKIEKSIPETVDDLLKHFSSTEVLPSRILLLNAKEDDSLTQSFITHHWSKSLPFLHMPQISLLSNQFDARASVQGAAKQLGFTVSSSEIPLSANITPLVVPGEKHFKHEKTSDEETEKETEKPHSTKDLATHIKQTEVIGNLSAENFGFVSDVDIETLPYTKQHSTPRPGYSEQEPFVSNLPYEEDNDSLVIDRQRKPSQSATSKLMTTLTSITSFLPKSLSRVSSSRSKLIILGIFFLLLIIGIPLLYSFLSSAKVTLNIKAKAFNENEKLTFVLGSSNDFDNNKIAAKTVEVSLEGEGTTASSGKKSIGEKAKGSVTIFNNTDSRKNLTAGTTITSSNNLEYTLDKEVAIASASGDAFSGTKPGTAQVSVTAKEIGTDSNLPSGTKFSISSNLAAKNDAAFSGGTKKDIIIVAAADRDKLLLQIPKDLENKAQDELKNKLSGEEQLLPLDFTSSVVGKEFDNNVGDEAKDLKAKITVKYTAIAYSKTDLNNFAKSIITKKTASDSNTPGQGIETGIASIKDNGDDTYTGDLVIKTGLLPKIDLVKLRQETAGKSVSQSKEMLSKLPQVESVDISLTPSLPFLSNYMPRNSEHITFLTQSHE